MTDILAWFSPTRWIILAVVVASLAAGVLGYGEWRAHSAREATKLVYEHEIDKLKVEAATRLATETTRVLALERDLATTRALLEDAYETRRTESKSAEQRLAAAVAAGHGRLRDPNSTGCGSRGDSPAAGPGAPAGGGGADPAEAGGLLSVELGGLLQRLEREADQINDAYSLCRGDSLDLRQKLNSFRGAEGP